MNIKLFASVYNDVTNYPTLKDVAEALEVSVKTVKNTAGIARREKTAKLISRKGPKITTGKAKAAHKKRSEDNPLSEKPALFMEDWTADDCIECLRKFQQQNDDKFITRNFFNKYSGISESTWNRYFGKFEEYKRSAGLILSRGQHRMELNISKHSGADAYRLMNIDKSDYEGKYRKPSNKRFRSTLVGSDFHDIECDPFVRRLFVETARRVQPEVIFLNGDMLDLTEFGKYTNDPRTWDVVGRIRWIHDLLRDLREASPDSEIIYLEGNHEFRLMRHLADATPALKAVLSDLHGFTVSKLLGLDEFEVNYVAKADLAAFTISDAKKEIGRNFAILYDAVLGHHFPEGRHMGIPGWNGHHHKHIGYAHYTLTYGASEWHQLGGGHIRNAEYCNGEKWTNGILLVHTDTQTKHSIFEYVDIRDFAVVGGQFYERSEEEKLFRSGRSIIGSALSLSLG